MLNNNDYSKYVNKLKVDNNKTYNAQTNAAGDTVADYINTKRVIQIGIIPLNSEAMQSLQTDIDALNVSISFLNPKTGAIENNISCILPTSNIEYYTIQNNNISFKALELEFIEL